MLLSKVFSLEMTHAQALAETPKVMISSASWSALCHGRRLVYTVFLTLSIGIHALGLHMLATVLPSIVAELGGAAFYTWATLLYTIASTIGTVSGEDRCLSPCCGSPCWASGCLVQRAVNTWRVVNRNSHTRHATTRPAKLAGQLPCAALSVAASGQVLSLVLRLSQLSSRWGSPVGRLLPAWWRTPPAWPQTSRSPRSLQRRPGSIDLASSSHVFSLSSRGVWYGSTSVCRVSQVDRMSEQSIDRAMY